MSATEESVQTINNESKRCGSLVGAERSLKKALKKSQQSSTSCKPSKNKLWTEAEINVLKLGVQIYGARMELIKAHFPNELKERSVHGMKHKFKNMGLMSGI